jgi:hypothetical protein
VCALLAAGATRSVAALKVGIDPSTLRRWARESPLVAADLDAAEAAAETMALAAVVAASFEPSNWQAAAWFLERRFPARWGRHRLRLVAEPEGDARVVKVIFGGRHLTLPPSGSEGGPLDAA